VERQGASFLTKPATKDELEDLFTRIRSIVEAGARHLLIVEDDALQRAQIANAIRGDVVVHEAETVQEAQAIVGREQVDCVILDLRLPGASGFDLLEHVRKSSKLRRLPVVIYTAADLTAKEAELLKRAGCELVVKGQADAAEDLMARVQRFLDRIGHQEPETTTLPAVLGA